MSRGDFLTPASPFAVGLAAEAAAFAPWFHNLHLPDGSQTAPNHALGDFPAFKWRDVGAALPADLTGWTALDIGCNAGFYSIELARRGARVTGIDVEKHFLRQAEWAVAQFGLESQIELHHAQIYDLAHWSRRFDLILFMGVFYHLRYPQLALDIVAEKANRLLVFQTLTMPGSEVEETPDNLDLNARDEMTKPGWPKMAFIEHSLAGDETNWWAPNHACVEAMLRSSGLELLHQPAHEIYVCKPAGGSAAEARTWSREELASATGLLASGQAVPAPVHP